MTELKSVWGVMLLLIAAVHTRDIPSRDAAIDVGDEIEVRSFLQDENEHMGKLNITIFASNV